MCHAELPSEVSLVRQAEDRAHRQGQGRPVNVYFLCARGTCDERHWQRLSSSLAKVTFVHDGPAGGGHIDGPAGDCGHAGHQGEGLKVDAVVSIGDDDLPEPSGTAAALPAQREGIAEPTGRTTPVEPTELEKPVGGESTEAPKQEDVVLQEIETFEQKDAGDAQQWWFEVSAHTHRVHFHAAADRTQRVNLSLPLEALCVGDAPCLGELITAVTHQLETAAVGQGIGKPGAVVSGIGPVAVDLRIIHSVPRLRSAIAAAKAFAREWRELKAADRSRLVNKVLQPPLEAAVEEVLARAESSGAFGTATERFADKAPSRRKDVKLPEGATWQQTEVYYQRYKRVVQYDQAVILPSSDTPAAPDPEAAHTAAPESAPGPSEAPAAIGAQFTRLCINCMKAVPGGSSAPVGAVLQTPCLLFCGPECEKRYAIRSSGTVGRRRVFQRDRGVCETCSLDCGTMVRRLQAVERGTKGCDTPPLHNTTVYILSSYGEQKILIRKGQKM